MKGVHPLIATASGAILGILLLYIAFILTHNDLLCVLTFPTSPIITTIVIMFLSGDEEKFASSWGIIGTIPLALYFSVLSFQYTFASHVSSLLQLNMSDWVISIMGSAMFIWIFATFGSIGITIYNKRIRSNASISH